MEELHTGEVILEEKVIGKQKINKVEDERWLGCSSYYLPTTVFHESREC